MNAAEQFRAAMAVRGYSPDDIIPDGKIHRFLTNEKPHEKAEWYAVFSDYRLIALILAGLISRLKMDQAPKPGS